MDRRPSTPHILPNCRDRWACYVPGHLTEAVRTLSDGLFHGHGWCCPILATKWANEDVLLLG